MKKFSTPLLAIVVVVVLSANVNAQISSISGSGPGGVVYNTAIDNNPPTIDIAFIATQFNSTNYIDIHIVVGGPGIYELYQGPGYSSFNNTPDTWNAMTFDNLTPQLGSFVNNLDVLNYWTDYSNKLSITGFSATNVTFGLGPNGPVTPISSLTPNGYFQAKAAGEIIVRQTPIAVPEPSLVSIVTTAGLFAALRACLRRKGLR